MKIIERDTFFVCGYSVETSLAEASNDVAALYDSYFSGAKGILIDEATKNTSVEYYGLIWYAKGHERYRYLLGKEAVNSLSVPDGAELVEIPSALYAAVSFEQDYDAIQAWTDFYYETLPQAGYAPDSVHGFAFEYYPNGEQGNYELWTSVVKLNV